MTTGRINQITIFEKDRLLATPFRKKDTQENSLFIFSQTIEIIKFPL